MKTNNYFLNAKLNKKGRFFTRNGQSKYLFSGVRKQIKKESLSIFIKMLNKYFRLLSTSFNFRIFTILQIRGNTCYIENNKISQRHYDNLIFTFLNTLFFKCNSQYLLQYVNNSKKTDNQNYKNSYYYRLTNLIGTYKNT